MHNRNYIEWGDLTDLYIPVEASTNQVKSFAMLFTDDFGCEKGELEAMAYLHHQDYTHTICSGDHIVFRMLAILDRDACTVSMETVLRSNQFSTKYLRDQFREAFRTKWISIGKQDARQERGLRRKK